MKFGSARGFVRKIIARHMPGLHGGCDKAVEIADSKPSVGGSDRSELGSSVGLNDSEGHRHFGADPSYSMAVATWDEIRWR